MTIINVIRAYLLGVIRSERKSENERVILISGDWAMVIAAGLRKLTVTVKDAGSSSVAIHSRAIWEVKVSIVMYAEASTNCNGMRLDENHARLNYRISHLRYSLFEL